jgi:uncharacterized protein with von Willebrand factor type A (vWA) domain
VTSSSRAHVYTRWDGSQDPDPFTAEALFDALADSILATGDPLEALRRALELGLELRDGERLEGLSEMLRQLALLREAAAGDQEMLARIERLETQLRTAMAESRTDGVDRDAARQLLGDAAARSLERMSSMARLLERDGLVAADGERLRMTAQGVRRIGERALGDVFAELLRAGRGGHRSRRAGSSAERLEETKPYEFGDAFLLDVQRTLRNALPRTSPGKRVKLGAGDLEVFRTEEGTRCATVLLIDTSRSMLLRGCFVAAKKMAIALETLIRGQFPGDTLYLVAFADRARELAPESLPYLDYRQFAYGTNLQDGLRLSRTLLGRHPLANRQVLLVTDGEPTAYLEDGGLRFAYPPTFQVLRATLREVGACTRDRIMINTFMLERSQYLVDFVAQMNKLNRGRAFLSDPERLGEYVLVDYMANRRKRIA